MEKIIARINGKPAFLGTTIRPEITDQQTRVVTAFGECVFKRTKRSTYEQLLQFAEKFQERRYEARSVA